MYVSKGKAVSFTLPAPEAQEVCVCGSFNNWELNGIPMKPSRKGEWKAQMLLPPGSYEYRFRVDGEWVDDPAAPRRVPNPFGTMNCIRDV